MLAPSSWLTFLHLFEPCFTTPGMLLFEQLVTAWALCPGRRTLTRIWSVIPAERRRRYGAYARWVREGTWSPDELGRLLVAQLVEHWAPAGRVILLLDDTLVNKSERGRRGRPRTKGERLAKPLGLAAALTDADWTTVQVLLPRSDGRTQALVARGPVVRDRPLSTPHARHRLRPTGHQYDDFFITSDTTLTPAEVAELYSDRWAIEDTHRSLKQSLGVNNPQSWVGDGPERVVALAGWLYSAVWHWYLAIHAEDPTWPDRPWCTTKRAPSFADALATLRGETWSAILDGPARNHDLPQIATTLISVLASAA